MTSQRIKKVINSLVFKDWVSIPKAVEILTEQIGVKLSEADLYKAAIDKQLTLSLYIADKIPVRFMDQNLPEILKEESTSGDGGDSEEGKEALRRVKQFLTKDFLGTIIDKVEMIDGVWDVVVEGNAGCFLQSLYNEALGFDNCDSVAGRKILTKDDKRCEIQFYYEELVDLEKYNTINEEIVRLGIQEHDIWSSSELSDAYARQKAIKDKGYKCAGSFPDNSLLVIKKDAFIEFIGLFEHIDEHDRVIDIDDNINNKNGMFLI